MAVVVEDAEVGAAAAAVTAAGPNHGVDPMPDRIAPARAPDPAAREADHSRADAPNSVDVRSRGRGLVHSSADSHTRGLGLDPQ